MDDIAGTINQLLQNPAIASLLGQLGGPGFQEQQESETEQPMQPPEQEYTGDPQSPPGDTAEGNPDFFSGMGLDPELLQTIMKLLPLLSQFRQEDKNTRFLNALRPMLGAPRQKKLDDSVKLMHLMKMLPVLKDQGVL